MELFEIEAAILLWIHSLVMPIVKHFSFQVIYFLRKWDTGTGEGGLHTCATRPAAEILSCSFQYLASLLGSNLSNLWRANPESSFSCMKKKTSRKKEKQKKLQEQKP